MAVEITRRELSAMQLRREAARPRDAKAALTMLALALAPGGRRVAAAQSLGVERQTLRDWVHRDTAEGLAGLVDRAHSKRTSPMQCARRRPMRRRASR